MFGKEIIPMIFRAKKIMTNIKWIVSSHGGFQVFFYQGYNESNSLGKYFYTSTIHDHFLFQKKLIF
jgi:hypothetical protein